MGSVPTPHPTQGSRRNRNRPGGSGPLESLTRPLVCLLLLAVLAVGALVLLPAGAAAQDCDETACDRTGTVEWNASTDGDAGASPTIVGDTAYVAANSSRNDGTLHAFDVESGEERWNRSVDGGLPTAPHVADGRVYVGSRHGNLLAFDAETGNQRWNASFGEGDFFDNEIVSSPTYAKGTVYVGAQDAALHAVDARTGEEKWAYETDYRLVSSPTVADGTVYVGETDGTVHAVDAATGTAEWRAKAESDLRSSPTVADVGDGGATVYVGYNSDAALVAFDAETGETEWRAEVPDAVYSSPTVADVDGLGETVFAGSHRLGSSLHAFDAETGEQHWRYRSDGAVLSSPTVVGTAGDAGNASNASDGQTVLVGSQNGTVSAVDAASGEERWSLHADGSVGASPTVADGTAYVGSGGGTFYALDVGENGSSEGSRVELGTLGHVGDRGAVEDGDAEVVVESVDYPETTTPGATVDLNVTVANVGEAAGSDALTVDSGADVTCSGDGSAASIEPGASETVQLACQVSPDATGASLAIGLSTTADTGSAILELADAPGAIEWSVETDYWVRSSPTIVDDTAYVGSLGDALHAVDTETGEERWNRTFDGQVYSSPQVANGTVYVGTAREGTVSAVGAETGDLEWQYEIDAADRSDDEVESSPTYADGTVYVGAGDDTIYALDAETGEERWTLDTGSEVRASPTVYDGTVYVGERDGTFYAVDAESGDVEWSDDRGAGSYSSPTVASVDGVGETLFVGALDREALIAYDLETGEERWNGSTDGGVRSSPTVANGTVYVGASDDRLYAFDAATGEERWRFETFESFRSSPTVVGDTVFVGSWTERLHALDADTGDVRWDTRLADGVGSSPTVADGTVYVGAKDNRLHAIDAGLNGSSEGSRVELGTLGHLGDRADTEESATESVEVVVADAEDGKPIPNATVTAGDAETTTDEFGVATLELEGDATDVLVGAAGYVSTSVDVGEDLEDVSVTLEPASEVDCQVVAGTNVCDQNGDGNYRDVNGDGSVTNSDVTTFFANQHTSPWNVRTQLFDFDGDDEVGQSDVISLFEYVAGG